MAYPIFTVAAALNAQSDNPQTRMEIYRSAMDVSQWKMRERDGSRDIVSGVLGFGGIGGATDADFSRRQGIAKAKLPVEQANALIVKEFLCICPPKDSETAPYTLEQDLVFNTGLHIKDSPDDPVRLLASVPAINYQLWRDAETATMDIVRIGKYVGRLVGGVTKKRSLALDGGVNHHEIVETGLRGQMCVFNHYAGSMEHDPDTRLIRDEESRGLHLWFVLMKVVDKAWTEDQKLIDSKQKERSEARVKHMEAGAIPAPKKPPPVPSARPTLAAGYPTAPATSKRAPSKPTGPVGGPAAHYPGHDPNRRPVVTPLPPVSAPAIPSVNSSITVGNPPQSKVDSKHSQPAASAAPIPNAQPSAAASVELDQSLADAQRMSDEKDEFARSRGIAPLSSGHREHADIGDVDADGALFGSGEPLLRPDNDVSDGLVGRVSAPAPAAVSLQSHLEQQRRIDQTKTLLTSGIHEHGLKPRDISDNLFPTNGAELYAQTQRPMRPNNLVWQLVPHVTYDNAEPKVKSISTEDEIGYEAIYVGMVHSLGEIRPDDNVTKAVVDAYLYPRVPTWTMLLKQMPVMDILLRTC